MKIRKANIENDGKLITNVYLYENKKEEYTMVAIPDIEWSTVIPYVEDRTKRSMRLAKSLEKHVEPQVAIQLTSKIMQWVYEM
ncbi:YueH family protein [Bacillus alveayuensis]|jgi:hypothetical protein|uniref:YueH-like protein n=1 Tax=Aeribacillus alveayuensis TaxID=279215 RepID=A0ABT9VMA4_9BACI|nr:YueH family protein [Bacillus alveayuensis]MDQ0162104.1 hypothetical protein [Bacillus alveayuensis]